MKFSIVLICFLVIVYGSLAIAMGGTPPATKEAQPKYKVEILNMDVITAPQTLESKSENGTNETEPKYKLEILKMDVITAPSPSPETMPDQKELSRFLE
jgi:hypothetical protein